MKKIILSIILMVLVSGCASMISYRDSEREMVWERTYRQLSTSSSTNAIRAVELKDGAGIGIDFSKLDVLTKHPVRQTGAAILDGALLYGLYLGIQELDSSSSEDSAIDVSGDGNILIINESGTATVDQSERNEENN